MPLLEGIYSATPAALGDGQQVELQVDGFGNLRTAPQAATGTNRLLSSAATTNATSVKGSAGVVTQINGYNNASVGRYLKLYDKATAPTVGTDTPRMTLLVQPGGFVFDCNDYYALGIGFAITAVRTDADTTPIAANDIECLNVDFR